MGRKRCTKCGECKPLSEFYKRSASKDGLRSECKDCKKLDDKKWRENNREYDLERKANWKKENRGKVNKSLRKRNEMKRALPYPTDSSDFDLVQAEYGYRCAVTGSKEYTIEHFIPISWGHGGSTINNIYPVSRKINMRKSAKNPFKFLEELRGAEYRAFQEVIRRLASWNGMSYREFHKYVNWCENNKRTVEQVREDNKKGLSSVDLWKMSN